MNELITYILMRISEGAATEDLSNELRLIQKLMAHIPSYHQSDALKGLTGGEPDAE